MVDSELRRTPLVFVEDLAAPELAPDDRAHLERSLRLRPGDKIAIGDGRGSWQLAILGDSIETIAEPVFEDRNATELTVAFSLVKGERSELVVQKLTELGIDRIAPIVTERCVVRWDKAKIEKNSARHLRIAREAAMQSRNVWLPRVDPATSFDQFAQSLEGPSLEGQSLERQSLERQSLENEPPEKVPFEGDLSEGALVAPMTLAEPGGPVLRQDTTVLVIGPEGGFSHSELAGRSTASLPGRVLRSETAAIAAGVLLASFRSAS